MHTPMHPVTRTHARAPHAQMCNICCFSTAEITVNASECCYTYIVCLVKYLDTSLKYFQTFSIVHLLTSPYIHAHTHNVLTTAADILVICQGFHCQDILCYKCTYLVINYFYETTARALCQLAK